MPSIESLLLVCLHKQEAISLKKDSDLSWSLKFPLVWEAVLWEKSKAITESLAFICSAEQAEWSLWTRHKWLCNITPQ